MALAIDTVALPDPPAVSEFTVPPNLEGGYFQVQGNAARIELVYGRYGAQEKLPALTLPTGSYSVGKPPINKPLVGIRAQNAVAGLGATFGGYFWTPNDPAISYIGTPSSTVVGSVVIPRLTVAEFVAIVSPTDQQVVIVIADATTDVEWMFQFDSSSGRWRFVGGPPLEAEVETSETTAAVAYGNLATIGPTVNIPITGTYLISHGCWHSSSAASQNSIFMSYDIGGTGAVDADSVTSLGLSAVNSSFNNVARTKKKAVGVVALVAKYKVGGGTQGFGKRWLSALPVFVTPP